MTSFGYEVTSWLLYVYYAPKVKKLTLSPRRFRLSFPRGLLRLLLVAPVASITFAGKKVFDRNFVVAATLVAVGGCESDELLVAVIIFAVIVLLWLLISLF